MTALDRPNRLYRQSDVEQFVGLKRSQINELVRTGDFPKPLKLTDRGRAKAWLESELVEWQQRRIALRDQERS